MRHDDALGCERGQDIPAIDKKEAVVVILYCITKKLEME